MMPRREWRLTAAFCGASVLLGLATGRSPILTIVGVGCLAMLASTLIFPAFLHRLFLVMMGLLLLGYAFFGKTFAYLGVGPVYVGEITLAVGLMAALVHRGWGWAWHRRIIWVLAAFVLWEATRAIPYVRTYGLDTLRDSALWGYSAFALLVACFLRPWCHRVPGWYARWIPRFLPWAGIALLGGHAFPQLLAHSPLSGAPMALVKAGDAGAHLGGVAAFLLLGLDRLSPEDGRSNRRRLSLVWLAWLFAFGCVAALGRSGALAALVAILVVSAFRPTQAVSKIPLIAGLAGTVALVLLSLNTDLELGRRDFSAQQIFANLGSVAGIKPPEGMRNLDETREWRLEWWTKIVNYTFHGKYFWSGKGYGVDLAVDDGITMNKDNRSPHSAHMNILARSGVPGLILWIMLQCSFAVVMVRAYVGALRSGREWWARVNLWALAYWAAFVANASFDVFLEGPQGGIWFWTIMGFGIAISEVQRSTSIAGVAWRSLPQRRYEIAART
jgi:hypothetical protein